MKFRDLLVMAFVVGSSACKPTVTRLAPAEESSPEISESAHIVTPKPQQPKREAYTSGETKSFTVLTDPWSKYFHKEPIIYLLPSLSKGVTQLLEDQQRLAKEILSNTGQISDRPEYVELEEDLDQLKMAVPGAKTASGYSRRYTRSYSPSYSYASTDGSYAYAKSGSNYSGYYTSFRNVHKSSSPALARSIENIVFNASVDDLDQRISALQQMTLTWSRRTNTMSPNGVEGVMRDANLAYLSSLKDYAGEWVRLQKRLKQVESLITAENAKKAARLEKWQAFELNRLPVIADYVERNHHHKAAADNATYELPLGEMKQPAVLLACEIGERTLYFNLSHGRHPDHPFRLVSLEQ
jgi:hypothetical protein